MSRRRLFIATGNKGKVAEFHVMLAEAFEVRALRDASIELGEVEETGDTFAANARIKALALGSRTRDWVLADDSGLEVDALGGAPGVFSARFAGEPRDDTRNNDKLLQELASTPQGQRTARFRCALCLVCEGRVQLEVDGVCEGRIAMEGSGGEGFGYDPLFIPEGHDQSFGQLGAEVKDPISHRGKAVDSLLAQLPNVLQ